MISLGLIGEYLARIYDEIKNRPQYIIAEVLDKQDPGSLSQPTDFKSQKIFQ
jgi:dolichol-phosphate mannosyltransferase